jgi:hypothetical protein
MKFALNHIASGVALAAASSAFAVTPNQPVTDYSTGTTDINLVGASAQDLAI